jgi:hypothetical protein
LPGARLGYPAPGSELLATGSGPSGSKIRMSHRSKGGARRTTRRIQNKVIGGKHPEHPRTPVVSPHTIIGAPWPMEKEDEWINRSKDGPRKGGGRL